MSQEKAIEMLTVEMGFNRTQVDMALKDTCGDVEKAIQKLLSGDYRPPPYELTSVDDNKHASEEKKHDGSVSGFFSGLLHRDKTPTVKTEEKASAPSLFDIPGASGNSNVANLPNLTSLPPPYQKVEKEGKIKDWEVHMQIEHLDEQDAHKHAYLPIHQDDSARFVPLPDERCPVCFNAVMTPRDSAHAQERILRHKGRIFHRNCFDKKHGPKCAYCFFPLTQADKDHELSGKYLVYQHKDYHVECYEKYAGPRCTYCFNVIIEKPSGEYSGNWVVDKRDQYHVECMERKMYTIYRAKHS